MADGAEVISMSQLDIASDTKMKGMATVAEKKMNKEMDRRRTMCP